MDITNEVSGEKILCKRKYDKELCLINFNCKTSCVYVQHHAAWISGTRKIGWPYRLMCRSTILTYLVVVVFFCFLVCLFDCFVPYQLFSMQKYTGTLNKLCDAIPDLKSCVCVTYTEPVYLPINCWGYTPSASNSAHYLTNIHCYLEW